LKFSIDENDPSDPYARFYSDAAVNTIGDLNLPRYGLAKYVAPKPKVPPTPEQSAIIDGLSRAGNRLKGFCRINLFKRLESSGHSFVLSLERHILRNFIVLHAIENGLDIPIGAQDSSLLDERFEDEDFNNLWDDDEYEVERDFCETEISEGTVSEKAYRVRAGKIYETYSAMGKRFKWLPSLLFTASLGKDLSSDARSLLQLLNECGEWRAETDMKLSDLSELINVIHPNDKVLVFTQFADTARYLAEQLKISGVKRIEAVTGRSDDPAELGRRFSPQSNENAGRIDELNVLIATDVLSEGQNLQDAHIIVNYDIPWAIIRLIQRAGRVDRIGQKSEEILCYSFMPADGVERIIRLRARIKRRMAENAEVVGSDENFFDDDENEKIIRDLYTEKNGSLDDDGDNEVDLASYAYQIWKNATDADPSLAASVEKLNDVVYSAKGHKGNPASPSGVLVYMRTSQGNDALSWVDEHGNAVTQSQFAILRAASCNVNTKALPRGENHHELVKKGVLQILEEEKSSGGALGRPSGARFKVYERLKRLRAGIGNQRDLFLSAEYVEKLDRVIEEIYRYPLYQAATDRINRQIKSGVRDEQLFELVLSLREEERLCVIDDNEAEREPRIICSMGLAASPEQGENDNVS
jgi:hypothetical protein